MRAAAVQMDISFKNISKNLEKVLSNLQKAAQQGAHLIVFPECTLSGYFFTNRQEASPYTIDLESEALALFKNRCVSLGVTGVIGILEHFHENLFNSAFIVSPEGNTSIYRKVNLSKLGVDQFVTPGSEVTPHRTPWGLLGTLICFDIKCPEISTLLAKQGVSLIALPTGWPTSAENTPTFITRTRAWDNKVFIVASNRVGNEGSVDFIGRSQIIDPLGNLLAEALTREETIIYADLDLQAATKAQTP